MKNKAKKTNMNSAERMHELAHSKKQITPLRQEQKLSNNNYYFKLKKNIEPRGVNN